MADPTAYPMLDSTPTRRKAQAAAWAAWRG